MLKDLDLRSKFKLEQGWTERLQGQLEADVALLQELGVMDYSLLLGVHCPRTAGGGAGGSGGGGGGTAGDTSAASANNTDKVGWGERQPPERGACRVACGNLPGPTVV